MLGRLGLRIRVALFFAAIALGGLAALAVGLWLGHAHAGGPIDGYVMAGTIVGFIFLGMAAFIGLLFDENVARPILKLSSDLKTRSLSDVEVRIDQDHAKHLGALAPAADALHQALTTAREEREAAVAAETAALAREKAVFAALLRDLSDGVVVCTSDHRVMLYNRSAQALLPGIGLNRPIQNFLRAEPLSDAFKRMANGASDAPVEPVAFLTSSRNGANMFLSRISPINPDGEDLGYVIMFQDATLDLASHSERDVVFNGLLDAVREPTAALEAVFETMRADAGLTPDQIETLDHAFGTELRRLKSSLAEMDEKHSAAISHSWPMARVSAGDIYDGLNARARINLTHKGDRPFLKCDGFAVMEMLAHVLAGLSEKPERKNWAFCAETSGAQARISVEWDGPPATQGEIDTCLSRPLSDVYGKYSGRDALAAHDTSLHMDTSEAERARLILPLRAAPSGKPLSPGDARPEFYDFALADKTTNAEIKARPLRDLTFVVFDTETTGLAPAGGDEIIQIAGIRIVNGRLLRGEVFDELVNPGRNIPAASTAVHHITNEMVADARDIVAVGRDFHAFCEDAVLVAHNAPFDMAFLSRKQAVIGADFTHPVVCTVLLSAVLFDHSEKHTLDALAHRYGVTIPPEARHTAIGDAIATAEVFLHMISRAEDRGITTLGDVLEASDKMTRIRKAQAY